MPDASIRPFSPPDQPALYRVCLETGDNGNDATGLHSDPDALGRIYVGPYLRFEPDLAFVLEDTLGVCGYVLGALDSAVFYRRYLNEWVPELRARFPMPTGDPSKWSPSQRIHAEYHQPVVHFPPEFAPYPSHMHIDLMARSQGAGWGRRMVARLMEEFSRRGTPGVHLCMSAFNERALGFYKAQGFSELTRRGEGEDRVIYLGRRFSEPVA